MHRSGLKQAEGSGKALPNKPVQGKISRKMKGTDCSTEKFRVYYIGRE